MSEVNPYQELVQSNMMSQEEADQKWANDKGTPPAGDPPSDPPANDPPASDPPAGDPPSGDPPANDPPAEPFYKTLGYENEDVVVSELNELRSMRERMQAIQTREAELNEKAQLISKFESPYSNDIVAKIDNAFVKLGISDLNVVARLVNTTAESVADDPITAIVAAKVIDNPQILSGAITFDKLVAIERNKLEKSGVDFTDKESIEYMSLLVESNTALTKINNFQQELGKVDGRYNFAKQEQQQKAQAFEESVKVMTPKVEELLRSEVRKFSVEGTEFEVQLTKDQLEKVKVNASNHAAQLGLNLSTAEGIKTLNALVDTYAKGAAVSSGEFEKKLYQTVWTKAKDAALEELSQGRPSDRSKPAGTPPSGGKTATELFLEEQMKKAEGKR